MTYKSLLELFSYCLRGGGGALLLRLHFLIFLLMLIKIWKYVLISTSINVYSLPLCYETERHSLQYIVKIYILDIMLPLLNGFLWMISQIRSSLGFFILQTTKRASLNMQEEWEFRSNRSALPDKERLDFEQRSSPPSVDLFCPFSLHLF